MIASSRSMEEAGERIMLCCLCFFACKRRRNGRRVRRGWRGWPGGGALASVVLLDFNRKALMSVWQQCGRARRVYTRRKVRVRLAGTRRRRELLAESSGRKRAFAVTG